MKNGEEDGGKKELNLSRTKCPVTTAQPESFLFFLAGKNQQYKKVLVKIL
jgi:hypothetical protein